MSVLIAFFALLTVGLLLDRLLGLDRRPRRARSPPGAAGPVAGRAGGASPCWRSASPTRPVASSSRTSPRTRPNTTPTLTWTRRSCGRSGPGADVMELPYVPYPEGYQPNSAPGQTLPFSEITNFEYELGRPYIQSHGLSFSYGAMKGRATNWAAQLAAKPLAASVIGVTAAGFPGLTSTLTAIPARCRRCVATLRRLLGVEPQHQRRPHVPVLRPAAVRAAAACRPHGGAAERAARGHAVPAAAELLARPADDRQPVVDDAAGGARRRCEPGAAAPARCG